VPTLQKPYRRTECAYSVEQQSAFVQTLVSWFLPLLLLVGFWLFLSRRMEGIADRFWRPFAIFEALSLMIFSVEYVARLWSAGADPKYSGVLGMNRSGFTGGSIC